MEARSRERKWLCESSWPRGWGLLHGCWFGGTGLAPQSEAVTKQSGKCLAFSPREFAWLVALTTRHFRQFPTFLGIFSSKGLEGSSILPLVTHGFFKLYQLSKTNPGLCCFTEQFRTYWSNTEGKVYRRYLQMLREYSKHIFGLLIIDLLMKYT